MNIAEIAVIATVMVALLGYCVTVFLYIHARFSAMSEKIDLKIEALRAEDSKARHDMRNDIGRETSKMDARISVLEREAVRQNDMSALEKRLQDQFTKIEGNLKDFCNTITKEVKEVSNVVIRLEARRDMGKEV